MFGRNTGNGGESPTEQEQSQATAGQKPELALKTFVVRRVKFGTDTDYATPELESFYIRAHFLSNLDGGGVAFNIYDFETPPQGITTVRVLNDYYDIKQELELPSDILKA